jgi:hypothetical protein
MKLIKFLEKEIMKLVTVICDGAYFIWFKGDHEVGHSYMRWFGAYFIGY